MNTIFQTLQKAHISVDGLFLNADAGFDSKELRKQCADRGVFPNICFNKKNKEHDDNDYVDEILYKERYSIERTNAWMDSFRSILNRFDTTLASWKAWNYIAFAILLLRKC